MSFDPELVRGRSLQAVSFDLPAAQLRMQLDGVAVIFERVRASNVLAPWDGTAGIVEWMRRVDDPGDEECHEVRVQYPEVPRVYRVVCGASRIE